MPPICALELELFSSGLFHNQNTYCWTVVLFFTDPNAISLCFILELLETYNLVQTQTKTVSYCGIFPCTVLFDTRSSQCHNNFCLTPQSNQLTFGLPLPINHNIMLATQLGTHTTSSLSSLSQYPRYAVNPSYLARLISIIHLIVRCAFVLT